jgi:hypothetical protein
LPKAGGLLLISLSRLWTTADDDEVGGSNRMRFLGGCVASC